MSPSVENLYRGGPESIVRYHVELGDQVFAGETRFAIMGFKTGDGVAAVTCGNRAELQRLLATLVEDAITNGYMSPVETLNAAWAGARSAMAKGFPPEGRTE